MSTQGNSEYKPEEYDFDRKDATWFPIVWLYVINAV